MVKALTSLALVLLWLSATVAEGASQAGLVLCFADGHVAVEAVHTDVCAVLDPASESSSAGRPVASALRAVGCADVPLGSDVGIAFGKSLTDRSVRRLQPLQAIPALAALEARRASTAAPTLGRCHCLERASPHLSCLQTIILRL